MLKAIIVDDEGKARRLLETLLTEYCPQITIAAFAEDVAEAVKAIKKHEPDVVFLDIEMPGYNGFQLLDFFEDINFEIVFTTAYSEFALRAFQVSAIDYLLKPIQIDQLVNAVQKLEKIKGNALIKERMQALQTNMEEFKIKKIVVPLIEGNVFLDVKDIVFLKAEGSYVNFYLKDDTKILASKNIKDFENQLTQTEGFFRTHRSYLINTRYINSLAPDALEVVLNNKHVVTIARERKNDFLQFIK